MSVLYRTYRPQKWAEVIGQDHIVSVLQSALDNNKVAHAYLFSGSRGTGKTTTARIFARALGTADEDVYEIDAASNRGIDDIRHLREHVSVSPFSSKYKVYIIDEVHMLSKDAWNALLKTLEEPPAHVIFILATTELDKVPETIISRCQTFTFRRPTREILAKQIATVAKKEGYTLDAGAADLVALLGDGSFRDALGILQKVISTSADTKITRPEVEKITGAPQASLVNSFVAAVIAKNIDEALSVLTQVQEANTSISTFTMLILEKLRYILLTQHSVSSHASIQGRVSPDDWTFISTQAGKKALTPATLTLFLEAAEAIGRAKIDVLPLEMAVVKVGSTI
ncbi:MAG: DNA polymerase III subunit gamma/tau [Patescibacteria group bacterium]